MAGDIAALIEENVSEFLLAMGRIGGGTQRSDDEITWTVGGSPIGYHNAVVRCATASARVPELVEEWRTELRARSLPGSWHLSPAMRPNELAGFLTQGGFEDGGEEPAMAARVSELVEQPPPEDLEIAPVLTATDLAEYRDILAVGFGEGPKEADWVASIYTRCGFAAESPWRHFVGRVSGKPVATASLFLTGATGGIYFVCTRPEMRRRGYGEAITHRAMAEAKASGAEFAVLGSSPMGQKVYERLGFQAVFSYRLFEFEP